MRRIYKAAAVSTVMAIIMSVLFMFSASAASVKYSASSASGAQGDTITINVNVSGGVGLEGSLVRLGYNPSQLQYVGYSEGGLVRDGNIFNTGSSVNFAGKLNPTKSKNGGTIFSVKFKILISTGTSTLTVSSESGNNNVDTNLNEVSYTTSNGTVTVIKPVSGISLNTGSVTLSKGGTAQLTATVSPSDATNKTVTFSSSNTKVATVSGSGKITAVGGGTAKITATAGGKSAVCNVSVNVKQTGITVSGAKDRTVGEGSSLKLSIAKVPSDATDSYAVAWSSSDTSVATVSSNGTVTGVKIGSAVITAKSNGWMAVYNITVTEKTSESESESSSEDITDDITNESTSADTSESTSEGTSSAESADNNGKKTNPFKKVFNAIFSKDDSGEPKTVTKSYHYAMLALVGVITALVSVPVTALVTTSICKSKFKNKDEEDPFGQNRE